ncbi:hypothetical protein NKH77_55525 [Streptomyces sp. M19]
MTTDAPPTGRPGRPTRPARPPTEAGNPSRRSPPTTSLCASKEHDDHRFHPAITGAALLLRDFSLEMTGKDTPTLEAVGRTIPSTPGST